jgi:hypothetical protein
MASVRPNARHLITSFALGAAVAVLVASPAAAAAIAGATYNGTVAGGSSMSFTVSGDGAGITSFSAAGPLVGDTCTFSNVSATYSTPLAIVNNAFADTTPPLTFSGSFPGAQSAEGTLRMHTTSPACDTGDLSWSATTTSTPPVTSSPPPAGASPGECAKAEEALTTARLAVKKARKRVKAAATPAARRRTKKGLRRAEARLRLAKERRNAAC